METGIVANGVRSPMAPVQEGPAFERLQNEGPQTLGVLLYGTSGSGKTYLAAQFPEPLFLACDPGPLGGLSSVRRFSPLYKRVQRYEDLLNALPVLRREAGRAFQTVVVDSVTYLQRIVMQQILSRTGREIPRFEDWNLCVERLRHLIVSFGELNCNLVMTALELLSKDEFTGRLLGHPNVPGKLAQELPATVDIVLHLYTRTGYTAQGQRQVQYMFSSAPDEIWVAKDRTGLLPKEAPASWESISILFSAKS